MVRRVKGLWLHRSRRRSSRRSLACDVSTARRLSNCLRGRARGVRSAAPSEGAAGVPHPRHGRLDRDPSFAVAAADSRRGGAGKRLGAGHSKMVQPLTRLRFFDKGLPDSRHFRAHGDTPALRLYRAETGPIGAGPLWPRTEGANGCGIETRRRPGTILSLTIDVLDRLWRMAAAGLIMFGLLVPWHGGIAAGTGTLVLKTATGAHNFNIEVATTGQERALGLMFRRSLPENAGMLFIYDPPQPATMWMKNTFIPLDMVFISAEGTVHRIESNTEPFSTTTIPSDGDVVGVLELNAGEADKIGLKRGDKVIYPGLANPGVRR